MGVNDFFSVPRGVYLKGTSQSKVGQFYPIFEPRLVLHFYGHTTSLEAHILPVRLRRWRFRLHFVTISLVEDL